jgi:hypothetical protein
MSDVEQPSLEELRASVQRACKPTYAPYIIDGRKRVAALPRPSVLVHIANESLNLADYWEYGRLLELLDIIEADELMRELVAKGLTSEDVDIRDMAELWGDKTD